LSEIGFFLGDLKAQLSHTKSGTDKAAFARKYFEQVQSCRHVIGMPYQYITGSNHNRRSFVYCLVHSFQGFSEDTPLTALDFFHLVEAMSPNFPKSLVLEVSQLIEIAAFGSGGTSASYAFRNISLGVYCYILYEDWLKLMGDYFAEEGNVHGINVKKLEAKVKQFHSSISPSVSQPSLELIYSVIQDVCPSSSYSGTTSRTGTTSIESGSLMEMTYEQFRRALFKSSILRSEINQQAAQHTLAAAGSFANGGASSAVDDVG